MEESLSEEEAVRRFASATLGLLKTFRAADNSRLVAEIRPVAKDAHESEVAMDRFGRTISSRWDNTGGSDTPFYQVELAYDRNSNITLTEDKIQHNGGANETFSAQYSMDNLNRLIRAEEGNWSGSAINNRTRDEQWTLSPTGNFSRRKIDLNGDGSFGGTDEIDDTGTFNKANEWLTRDTDSNGSTNYTLTHDAVGQLTDDGKDYKYKYDGFGRLKEVKNQSNNLVAEYRYNGLQQHPRPS